MARDFQVGIHSTFNQNPRARQNFKFGNQYTSVIQVHRGAFLCRRGREQYSRGVALRIGAPRKNKSKQIKM